MNTFLLACSDLNASSATAQTFADCGAGSLFGGDYLGFAIVFSVFLVVFAYYYRLPQQLALIGAFTVFYMFDIIAGGNNFLQMGMVLIGLGMAVSIVKGVWSYVFRYSQ